MIGDHVAIASKGIQEEGLLCSDRSRKCKYIQLSRGDEFSSKNRRWLRVVCKFEGVFALTMW